MSEASLPATDNRHCQLTGHLHFLNVQNLYIVV